MLAPEPVAKFHDFVSSDGQALNPNAEMIASQRPSNSSWRRREFSSDEENYFPTSSTVTQQFPVLSTYSTNGVNATMSSSRGNFLRSNELPDAEKMQHDPTSVMNSLPNCAVSTTPTDRITEVMTSSNAPNIPSLSICEVCDEPILSAYLCNISGRRYHEECCKCCVCETPLTSKCFVNGKKLFCKKDYEKIHKICRGCDTMIPDGETIMRLMTSYVFHLHCFKCGKCGGNFKTGDKYVINYEASKEEGTGVLCIGCMLQDKNDGHPHTNCVAESETTTSQNSNNSSKPKEPGSTDDTAMSNLAEENKNDTSINTDINDPVASPHSHSSTQSTKSGSTSDYDDRENATGSVSNATEEANDADDINDKEDGDSDGKRPKRPRTILNATQRQAFKVAFDASAKPCRKVRDALAAQTGLSPRVVQVWFQNQRAKMKKLAKRQQSQERALALNSREHYGYHGYDPMASLPHPSVFAGPQNEAMMDQGYPLYPSYQQDNPMWERVQGPPQPPYQTHGYTEAVNYRSNDAIAGNDGIQSSIPSSHFGDFPYQPPATMERQGDYAFTQSQHQPLPEPQEHRFTGSGEIGAPMNEIYPMQSQYFTS